MEFLRCRFNCQNAKNIFTNVYAATATTARTARIDYGSRKPLSLPQCHISIYGSGSSGTTGL
jgi:hypothetical protein